MENNVDDIFAEDYAKFHVNPTSLKNTVQYEFKALFNIHSPVVICIFKYLASNDFKKLGHDRKNKIAYNLTFLFDHLHKFPENVNQKGFIEGYFKEVKKCDITSRYNDCCRALRSIVSRHSKYNVPHSIEIRNALREIPFLVTKEWLPRLTLGDKLLGANNTANNEKRLWSAFNAFIRESWEISHRHRSTISAYYDTSSEYFEESFLSDTSGSNFYRDLGTLGDKILEILADLYKLDDQTSLHLVFSHPNPIEQIANFTDDNRVLYRNRKILRKGRLRQQLIHPIFLTAPTPEESTLFLLLLAKYQFTHSMLKSLRGSCLVFNDDVGDESVQISEYKSRAGPNPDAERGHSVVFTQRKNRFEYNLVQQYYDILSLNCQIFGSDINAKKLLLKVEMRFYSLGFLEKLFKSKKEAYSEQAGYFFKVWASNREGKTKFSIASSTIAQTQKTMMFDYQVEIGGDGDLPIEDEIEHEQESNQRVHSRQTDVNIYEARNISPVLLDADHKVGRQVANLFTEEARSLGASIKTMSLTQIRQAYGLANPSELLSNGEDLKEFLDKTGCDVTDYLGIKREEDIVIIKHPLVLAMMKEYIKHIDRNLTDLIIDQQSTSSIFTDKIVQTEARRIVIASLIEEFDETLHASANKILDEYELPTFPPLI